MALILGKIRCCFCEKKYGLIHSVHDYGEYGEVGKRIFYHPECLELMQMYPRSFDHRSVDMAIFIVERIEENNETTNSKIIKDYQNKTRKLEISHWERMIPKRKKA